MKKHLFSILLIFIALPAFAQLQRGSVVTEKIDAPSLKNPGGEDPVRRVTIYLPPGYDKSKDHYPVIYYLHGFGWTDSNLVAIDRLDTLLDKGIASGRIKPVIVVMPDEYTMYKGSFYTNSSLTGHWSDFTAIDLVAFIDKRYRTIPSKESRGIAGHSMGGHGALKIAMLFPDVFSCVYALSPALLYLSDDLGPESAAYKRAQQIATKEQLVKGWDEVQANLVVAVGRAYSPNPAHAPFYTDLPFTYEKDSLVINQKVLDLWNQHSPFYMIDQYIANIRKLTAIKFDWGRNDEYAHIPVTCKMFSKKLESLGINHYAEEYIGTHGSRINTSDGRIYNDLMPFFDTYLKFNPR